MNQELPKPMLDALNRETTPTAHPSPDVLTAFVERALWGGEKQRVTDHLARCAQCREAVFLASNAAEEPVEEEQNWMAAAAVPRISPALTAKAHAPQAMSGASPAEAPQRRWAPRMVWAVPLAAVALLIASVVVQQRLATIRSTPPLTAKVVSNVPAPPLAGTQPIASQPATEPAANKPALERHEKTVREKSVPAQSVDMLAMNSKLENVANESHTQQSASPAKAVHEPAAIAIGGASAAMAPVIPRANGFVAGEAESETPGTGQFHLTPNVSNRVLTAALPQWRVTTEGHLEHSVPGGWMRVLANQTSGFRVVSVVGNDVWAGGDGGALFHSSDGGQHWNKVTLATPSGSDTGTIVSIQFDDLQHGVVVTESGSRYSTGDGGTTWTKD